MKLYNSSDIKTYGRHFAGPVIALVIIASCVLWVAAQAAIVWFGLNAESGTLSGQTQVISDALAANGSAIGFTSGGGGITLPNPGSWTNATGNMANMPSECGNVQLLSAVPGQDKVIAGVSARGLYATTNGGQTWTAMGTGAGSAAIQQRPYWIVYDPLDANTFWVAGNWGSGGVYKTTNGGNTFQQLGTINHLDYISVDFTDPARQTLLAGPHEAAHRVYKSTNGGQTWTDIGGTLPSNMSFSTHPHIINANTYIVNGMDSWGGGEIGIWRTTNGGTSWQKVSNLGPAQAPLITSTGAIYWAASGGLAKSTDSGQTWTLVGSNLYGNSHPIELPDGRIVAGSGSNLVVTANGGTTWTPFGANLPFGLQDRGVTYNPSRNAFFIWQWDCGGVVLPNAIYKLQ